MKSPSDIPHEGYLPHSSCALPVEGRVRGGQRVGTDVALYVGVKTPVFGEKGVGNAQ